jgi:hypothetical protein
LFISLDLSTTALDSKLNAIASLGWPMQIVTVQHLLGL